MTLNRDRCIATYTIGAISERCPKPSFCADTPFCEVHLIHKEDFKRITFKGASDVEDGIRKDIKEKDNGRPTDR